MRWRGIFSDRLCSSLPLLACGSSRLFLSSHWCMSQMNQQKGSSFHKPLFARRRVASAVAARRSSKLICFIRRQNAETREESSRPGCWWVAGLWTKTCIADVTLQNCNDNTVVGWCNDSEDGQGGVTGGSFCRRIRAAWSNTYRNWSDLGHHFQAWSCECSDLTSCKVSEYFEKGYMDY